MLQSLSRTVENSAKAKFGLNVVVNGKSNEGWITIDYGDLIVHIFSAHQRDYYLLEDLWAEGKTLLRLK